MPLPIVLLTLLTLATRHAAQGESFQLPCEASLAGEFSTLDRLELDSQTQVKWNTNISSYEIRLMQMLVKSWSSMKGPAIYQKRVDEEELGEFEWTVTTTQEFDLEESPVYFFNLYQTTHPYTRFASCYFNITLAARTPPPGKILPTTTAGPMPTGSGSLPSLSSSSLLSSSSSASTVPRNEDPEERIMHSARCMGFVLGVSLGIGIPLVLGIAASVIFYKRRREWIASKGSTVASGFHPHSPQLYPQDPVKYVSNGPPRDYGQVQSGYGQTPCHHRCQQQFQFVQLSELPSDRQPAELAGR